MNKEEFESEEEKKELDLLTEQINNMRKERKRMYIEDAMVLGEKIEAEVVGVWGHLTGAGGREYAVYKKKEEDIYFCVLGKVKDFESYDAPEEVRKRAKGLVLGKRFSIGEYEIKYIDPKNTFNKAPVRSVEEFLGE